MIYWAPLLHFYQPPIQLHWVLEKVCDECYRPLIRLFRDISHAKVTVNINGILTDLLDEHGQTDVIKGLRGLAERGQVEFVGSGKYHPILPLIPPDEMRRQIELNYQTNRQFFGDVYAPKGFFPPEMAYSHDIVGPILETGHRWIILSGIACPVLWPLDVVNEVAYEDRTLSVFFRDDIISNKISFHSTNAVDFLQHLTSMCPPDRDAYIITAMDAETFGHHIKNWDKLFLARVYQALEPAGVGQPVQEPVLAVRHPRAPSHTHEEIRVRGVQVVTISQLFDIFARGRAISPKTSSWSTTTDDLRANNPFPLWKDRDNIIHQLQSEHTKIALSMVHMAIKVADNEVSKNHAEIARDIMDRALHSDQYWWASRRPMWEINMINRGLMQQHEAILNAFKAIKASGTSDEIKTEYYYREIAARDIANKIRDRLFME